jgi:hypothetical protein
MADKKITDLVELNASAANDDLLAIVDASDTTGSSDGTSKQITAANLLSGAPDNSTPVTLATVASNYLSLSGQQLTAGTVPVSLGGTGATTAAAARTSLGVDASGTDNSTDVTLATVASNYLSLSGQQLTAGTVPVSLGGTGATTAAAARTSLGLGTAATQTVGTSANNVVQLDGSAKLPAVDGSALTNLPSPDVNGLLTTALRGTDNPHIGANPNQSFKVVDNPSKSVMIIADADGNLDFLVKSDSASIYLNTPSARKAASFGFSVVEDSTEPDIEVVGTLAGASENYSVISGDSDSKGANGLPIRQGFQNPDIGANPAPILISGGTIA